MAVLVTTADTTTKPAEAEHAWHMMRSYLADCAKEKKDSSKRRTEELNGVIRACVERLAVDRRDGGAVRDARLPLDALGHAIRYVDEHLDAKIEWDDMPFELGMDAFAFGAAPRRQDEASVSADMIAMLRYGLQPNDPGRPLEQVAGPFWRVPAE